MSEQASELSDEARKLLELFESEYLDSGYMYSGSLGPGHIERKLFAGDSEARDRALDELQKAGIILLRRCEAFKYELTVERRAALIERHKLALVWTTTMPARVFYPTGECGEVTYVLRELLKRDECQHCEGRNDAHTEGCTNPEAPNFCKRCEQVAEHCQAGHCLNCDTDSQGWSYYTDCFACNFATGLTRQIPAA